MRMKLLKIGLSSILLSIILFLIVAFFRGYSRIDNSILFGLIAYFLITFFLLKKYKDHKRLVVISIILPHLLFHIIALLFYYDRFFLITVVPNFLFVLSSLVALWVLHMQTRKKAVLTSLIFGVFSLLYAFVFHPFYTDFFSNYISDFAFDGINNHKTAKAYLVFNEQLEEELLVNSNEKLVTLDMWTKYCSECFRKFPDFEQLSKDYSSNNIVFKSFGIPMRDDTVQELQEVQRKYDYSFKKVYGKDDSAFKDFNFNAVPTMFLLKDGEVIYRGTSYFWLKKAIKAHS